MGGKCTTEGAGTTRGVREAAAVREAAGETAAAEAAAQAAEEAAAAVGGATGMVEGRGELRFPFSSPPPPPFYRLARDSINPRKIGLQRGGAPKRHSFICLFFFFLHAKPGG